MKSSMENNYYLSNINIGFVLTFDNHKITERMILSEDDIMHTSQNVT